MRDKEKMRERIRKRKINSGGRETGEKERETVEK